MKNKFNEANRIISPSLLFSDNKKDIEALLKAIAKKYKISVSEAAIALAKTLQKF